MKCRYCGNPISPEDKKCPSCLWEGDDLAIPDDEEVKAAETEEPAEEKDNATQNTAEQAENTAGEENAQKSEDTENGPNGDNAQYEEQPMVNNIVVGLTKKEFFDFYIPEKIRSNALWAAYLLFASALINCISAFSDFYTGIICAVVCLGLAIAIKKTLSIGPAIAACVFSIFLTGVNLFMYETVSGWWSIVASIYCIVSLSKFNSMWVIYTATSKVPILDPIDTAQAERRKSKKKNIVGWVVYYVAMALVLVGVVVHFVFATSYVSKFTVGETNGNHYTNEFFSIDMTLDSGWTILDKEQLSEMNEDIYWMAEPTATDMQYVMYAYNDKDDYVMIESMYMETLIYNGSDVADEYEATYRYDADSVERLADVEYNGKKYEVLAMVYTYTDTDANGNEVEVTYYDKCFVRTEGSYCVTIYVTAHDEASLENICAMLLGEKAE